MKTLTSPSFVSVVMAPLERFNETPLWAKFFATLVAVGQYAAHDMFTGAMLLCTLSGIMDYFFGVRAAKATNEYQPGIAHAGVLSKLMGIGLILLIRAGEFWANNASLLNTKGIIATVIAISLFGVDIQSIAHHREKLGASPIPVLSPLLDLLQRGLKTFAQSKVPAVPKEEADDRSA